MSTITRTAALLALAGTALAANADDATFDLLPEVFTGTGVSDDGTRIIGINLGGLAYLYTNGVPQNIGNVITASAISGDGNVVVGEIAEDGLEYAGRWTEATGWVNLGDLDLGGCDANRSSAFGTNHDGSIVVGLGWEGCKGRGFVWTEGGGMVVLPQSITDSARANGVSDDGSIIGGWQQGNCRQAAAWLDGTNENETLLAPADCGEVFGVSADGSVIFGQSGQGFVSEAMYWTPEDGLVFLGNNPFHNDEQVPSGVLDMNADGSIMVGYSGSFFDGYLATIWTEDGPQDLKQYLVAAGASGLLNLTLEYATGVSADGTTIIGRAFNPQTFETTGFVATLPGAGCYADFDGDGELTILDFVAYQNAFTAGDMSADCDGDGNLSILDFVCFQNAFTAGCA